MPDTADRPDDLPSLPREGSAEAASRELARLTLLADQPLEIKLAAITTGDPLGLYPLGALRVRQRFHYFDPDRVYAESAFNVAAMSLILRGGDDFDPWLTVRVDEAIDNLLRRDGEAVRKGRPCDDLIRESGEYLTGCWGLPADEAFEAAVRFNALAERSRRTFFALLVEHRTVEQCLKEGLGPREEMREYAVRAVEAILGPRPESIPNLRVQADLLRERAAPEGTE